MTERNDKPEATADRGARDSSRRSVLLGSGALLVGGIAGRMSKAEAASEPKIAPAPPLPWKWTNIDPMEAGTRTYQAYLKQKG